MKRFPLLGLILIIVCATAAPTLGADTMNVFGLVIKNSAGKQFDAGALSSCLTQAFEKSYSLRAVSMKDAAKTDRFALQAAGKKLRVPYVVLLEIKGGAAPTLLVRRVSSATSRDETKSYPLDGSWGPPCDTAFTAITQLYVPPLNAEARKRIGYGNAELEKGNRDNALAWYENAVEAAPDQPEPAKLAARLCRDMGNDNEAMAWYGKALEANPVDPWAIAEAAQAALHSGDIAQAISYYQYAINSGASTPRNFIAIGDLYFKQGRFALAIESYLDALSLDADDAEALPYLVSAYDKEDRFREAARYLVILLKTKPDAKGLLYLADLYERAEEYGSSAQVLEQIRDAGDDSRLLKIRLAQAYEKSGQVEKALDAYVKLQAENPADLSLDLSIGRLYYRQKQYPEAIAWLQKVRAAQPREVEAIRLEAMSREFSGDIDGALGLYAEALRVDHANPSADVARFLAFAKKHDRLPEASAKIRELIKTKDKESRAVLVTALGERLTKDGRIDDAISLYESARDSVGSSVNTLMALGDLYLQKGDKAKAKEEFESASKISGSEDRVPIYAATRFHKAGDFQTAKNFYLYAFMRNPTNAGIVLALAEIMILTNDDPDWASFYFSKADELPMNPSMKEKQFFMEIIWGMKYDEEAFARGVLKYCMKNDLKNAEPRADLEPWAEWIAKNFDAERRQKALDVLALFNGQMPKAKFTASYPD